MLYLMIKLLKKLDWLVVIKFLISSENLKGMKILQFFSHIKYLFPQKIGPNKDALNFSKRQSTQIAM